MSRYTPELACNYRIAIIITIRQAHATGLLEDAKLITWQIVAIDW